MNQDRVKCNVMLFVIEREILTNYFRREGFRCHPYTVIVIYILLHLKVYALLLS